MKRTLTTLLIAGAVFCAAAVAKPTAYKADTPEHAAQSFLSALKKRDLKGAQSLCDVAVNSFTPYGAMDGSDYPVEPKAQVQVMAARVTDSWTAETNPDKIRVASDARAYEPKYFFKSDKTYYAIADKDFSREQWATFADNEKLNLTGVAGYVVFLHKVNGRWLVFRVVENGVIATPR
jgi:hypothetical protein